MKSLIAALSCALALLPAEALVQSRSRHARVAHRRLLTRAAEARLVSSVSLSDDDEDDEITQTEPVDPLLPRMIVFDLDQTLWTPELYKLRRLPGYEDAAPPGPKAGVDVELLPGAVAALEELATDPKWRHTRLACASRTNKGPWARGLLKQFRIAGTPLHELLQYHEIFPGSKDKHFANLRERSGVTFEDMLFFDDARDGRYGNCQKAAAMGVCSAYVPRGVTPELWSHALKTFADLKAKGRPTGVVIDGPSDEVEATIVSWRPQKNYGFVEVDGIEGNVFFHGSRCAPGFEPAVDTAVRARLGYDGKGRRQCDAVAPAGDSIATDLVRVPCFSMNMPFAGLVARGHKTLETRNGTMFKDYAGQLVALHVGRRTYPDGGMHREILARPGRTDAEIDEMISLPEGFGKGSVVAVVRVGDTRFLPDERDRSAPEIEAGAVATGAAMGRYLTTLTEARLLPRSVPLRGQPGIFGASLPRMLFDGGELPGSTG